MSDPGWDIPGIERDAASCGAASGGVLTDTTKQKARTKHRHGSISASAGLSAGAFAPAASPGLHASATTASATTASATTASATAASAHSASESVASGGTAADTAGDLTRANPGGAYCSVLDDNSGGTGAADDSFSSSASAGSDDELQAGNVAEALRFLRAALEFLARDDPAQWSEGSHADCLRALAVAESRQVAAHASVLSAFSVPGGGLNGDGHRSPRAWLTWQARATKRAAAGQVAWMRRLNAHPRIAAALAAGTLSVSWARQLAESSDRLPEDVRDDADQDMLTALSRGADLADLAALAEELRKRHAFPDTDGDRFEDRTLRIDTTFDGAGRIEGDLTTRCAKAVETVLDSLGQRRGPEDDRTLGQRRHDALEEACLRLISSSMLPQRAGQAVRLELDVTLQDLINGDRDGDTCDAIVQPVISGMPDLEFLDELSNAGSLAGEGQTFCDAAAAAFAAAATGATSADSDSPAAARLLNTAAKAGSSAAADQFGDLLETAVRLLSGPRGYARYLRRGASRIASGVSLPLEIPSVTDTIPLHLRRAVRRRDRHCRFPGCDMPVAACDVHHLRERSKGGPHATWNLILLCRFHHQIAIHRWGWTLTLHSDGTTTATCPDRSKTFHSHAPPTAA